ncbi:MAG: alginate O-acetyltransferase AlgX-related protein [Luteolibacter sp.]
MRNCTINKIAKLACYASVALAMMSHNLAAASVPIDWSKVLQAGNQAGIRRFEAHENWYFLPADLKHLASSFQPVMPPTNGVDPVSAVVNFHTALKEKGIHLVLLPVPEKPRIRADRLVPEIMAGNPVPSQPLEAATGRFLDQIRQKGVDVFDPSALFYQWLTEGDDPVYCRTDSHFTPRTCERLAEALVELRLSDYAHKGAPRYQLVEQSIQIHGDLADDAESEDLKVRVVQNLQSGDLFSPNSASPVLLMGDSHCLVFHSGGDMHSEGAGLFDHLTARLESPPALIAVRGSGSNSARVTLFRQAKQSPEFLKSKKTLIWCFAAREFTQSEGWKKIPLP